MCSRRVLFVALAMAVSSLAGCGGGIVPDSGEEVQVTGKVPPPAGKSLSGYSISFQATGGKARQAVMPLAADGSFSGTLTKGKYSYSVVATKAPASEKALEAFPDSYKQPSLDRQVDVNGGAIELKF